MRSHRRCRLLTVLFALVSLLHMQFALASYVCPGAVSGIGSMSATSVEAARPCAEPMQLDGPPEQQGLCHAHCQAGQQSADKYEPPSLPALTTFGHRSPLSVLPQVRAGAPRQKPWLTRSTAPALAIRNCCWRI